MKKLIPIGFYKELRGGKPHEPSLREAIASTPQSHESSIVHYLKSGKLLIGSPGVVRDVLDSAVGMISAPHILTDGVYAWPAVLAYYVERYHVQLPSDFLANMSANQWTIPQEIDTQSIEFVPDPGT